MQNELDNIERKVYDLMDEVNFNENWAANTSSLAIRNKLLNLENRVSMRKAHMERAIAARLKNLFVYIRKKEGREFDYRDVVIKFTCNLPTDLVGLANVVVKLRDVCSHETLLTLLPFIESANTEAKKFQQEQKRGVAGGNRCSRRRGK